jgi:hypothetical protein
MWGAGTRLRALIDCGGVGCWQLGEGDQIEDRAVWASEGVLLLESEGMPWN